MGERMTGGTTEPTIAEMAAAKWLSAVQENAHATAERFKALANAIAERPAFAPLALRARARAAELEANKFTIMVVGEFKRGKSTVLNALLGKVVLPARLPPCTAVVTFVRHGAQEEVSVKFNDDRKPNPESITLKEFHAKYQLNVEDAQSGGPPARDEWVDGLAPAEAARREIEDRFGPVDHADIRFPSPYLENGVEIVDTPGLNEHDARTERVLRNLGAADAVVMVLDAVTVANQQEIDFIENRLRPLGLHRHVFFLINRWNIVLQMVLDPNDPEEVARTLEEQFKFIRTRLEPFLSLAGTDKVSKRLFKVNALGALKHRLGKEILDAKKFEETEIPAFERALLEFLAIDRDTVRRDRDLQIAMDIERQIATGVNTLVRQAQAPIQGYETEKTRLDADIEQLRRINDNIKNIIRASAAATASELSTTFNEYMQRELFENLTTHIEKFDLGELEKIWASWELIILDPFRKKKAKARIEANLNRQITDLISSKLGEWCRIYRDPELKRRAANLQNKLHREVGAYIKIVQEMQGQGTQSGAISEEDIARQISSWLRSYQPEFSQLAFGVGIDLAPLIAGVAVDIVWHVVSAGAAALTAGVSLIATGLFAWARTEYSNGKVREKIVDGLTIEKANILSKQKEALEERVNAGFEMISKPITVSIESEIAVLLANMTDILERRSKADFDAKAEEESLRAFQHDVAARVGEIRRLVVH